MATSGFAGCGGDDSEFGRPGLNEFTLGAPGGFGAVEAGSWRVDFRDVSGSERYEESRSAPVSMPPPVFFSFGIPIPANIPPNCGAAGIVPPSALPAPWPLSLLLLARFGTAPGTGGAKPGLAGVGVIAVPVDEPDPLSSIGADRSFVTAFLSLVPLVMSPSKAPYSLLAYDSKQP